MNHTTLRKYNAIKNDFHRAMEYESPKDIDRQNKKEMLMIKREVIENICDKYFISSHTCKRILKVSITAEIVKTKKIENQLEIF